MISKPHHGDFSQFGMTEFDKPKDILSTMLRETEAQFKDRATPGNQDQIVSALRAAGYRMDQITDHLPHLMYHLGAGAEQVL